MTTATRDSLVVAGILLLIAGYWMIPSGEPELAPRSCPPGFRLLDSETVCSFDSPETGEQILVSSPCDGRRTSWAFVRDLTEPGVYAQRRLPLDLCSAAMPVEEAP